MVPQLIMKPTSLFRNSGNSWTTCRKHDPLVTRLWEISPRTTTDYQRCKVATIFCRIPRPEFSSPNETYIATYTYMKIYLIIKCVCIYIYKCCINWIKVTIQILFVEIIFGWIYFVMLKHRVQCLQKSPQACIVPASNKISRRPDEPQAISNP